MCIGYTAALSYVYPVETDTELYNKLVPWPLAFSKHTPNACTYISLLCTYVCLLYTCLYLFTVNLNTVPWVGGAGTGE